MLNFLNSTVLFAAAAALIPLIIHLFSKRRVKTVEFSSLKHLKAMQKRQVRRLKIRQLLLLLLRMLIILAVVLAFARPTTTGGSIGSHASVSAVLLFDNSASMNRHVSDGNLFEIARERTRELLATFGEADEVCLTPLDRTTVEDPRGESFTSAAVATDRLDRLTAGFGEADLESSLEKAGQLLAGAANLNKEVYVISDRQRFGLPQRTLPDSVEARLILVDLPVEAGENCGVTGVDLGGELLMPGHDFDITATVKNYGGEARSDLIVSLFLDGHRVAQTDAAVSPGQETGIHFSRSVSRTGFHSGWVELSDDRLLADNRFYFGFHIPDRFNVLMISGDEAARFISLALTPSATLNQYWSVKQARPDELAGVSFTDYDVIILSGSPLLSETYYTRLKSFVERGRSLLITYDCSTDIGLFNTRLAGLTGVTYDEAARTDFSRAGYYNLGFVDGEHPVFSVFDFETNPLPEVRFFTLPRVTVGERASVLMRFSGDHPALIENGYGPGKVLTFTGPLAPSYTDFTSQAFFVPFIARLIEYLASDLSSVDLGIHVGDRVTRGVTIRGSVSMPLVMTAPDSTRHRLPPEEERGSLVFHPQPISMPGVYRVDYLGQEVDRFAVNVAPHEGDLAAAEFGELATACGATEHTVLDSGAELATVIAELRFGKELWQLFLWLAVILVAAEMLLARGVAPEDDR